MAVIATGFFDGVHMGHRKVIDTLLRLSRERSEQSVILTFWPHPRMVLQDDARSLRLLNSLEEKKSILQGLGVDRVEVLPFDLDFSAMSARDYLEKIVRDRFGASCVVFGYDNRLGCDGVMAQNAVVLARELGMEAVCCASLGDISSTKIRNCIATGRIEAASQMLGMNYRLKGAVIGGNRIGRTLGYPTANTSLYEPLKALPLPGAYLTRVNVGGGEYYGMTNVGDDGKVETHIFDFSKDIYGLDIDLEFLRYLRAEMKFGSLEDLKTQLGIDEMSCRNIIFGL